jgi:hypothetical protein
MLKKFFISLVFFITSFMASITLASNDDFWRMVEKICGENIFHIFFIYTLCFIPLLIFFRLKKLKIATIMLVSSYLGLMVGTFVCLLAISQQV